VKPYVMEEEFSLIRSPLSPLWSKRKRNKRQRTLLVILCTTLLEYTLSSLVSLRREIRNEVRSCRSTCQKT
jgi:hypothetical protein